MRMRNGVQLFATGSNYHGQADQTIPQLPLFFGIAGNRRWIRRGHGRGALSGFIGTGGCLPAIHWDISFRPSLGCFPLDACSLRHCRLGNAASPRRTVHQWLWHPAGGRGNARRALADLVAGVAGKIYRRDPDHRRRALPGPRRALHPDGRYGGKRRVPVIPSRQD